MGVAPIAEPLLTPCPPGWSTVARADREDGLVTCHPYDGEPDVCPDGWAHFIGDGACMPVGAPCPMGDFPEGLPADVEVLYVLSSAPAGGDGTEGSPFMTITDGMNVASRGMVIAIGKGTYDEAVRVGPGITLWGACATETRVTASSPGPLAQGILTVPSPDVRVKNLRLGPANLPGVVVFGTRASASFDGLLIDSAQEYGFRAHSGARVDGRELSISNTRSDAAQGFGWGLAVETGATVVVTRALFSRNRQLGVLVVDEGTSVTLSDAVVEDTRGQESEGAGGRGLSVESGATAVVSRVLFSRNRHLGVFVVDEGTSVTLSDVVVEDTQGQESDGTGGWGLGVQLGATAEVTRALFSGNRQLGVLVAGGAASLTLSDVVVEGTQGQESDGAGGWGLGVQTGATAVVTRALFSGNRESGVFAAGVGTSLTLSDLIVEGTQGRVSDGGGGRGLGVQTGATAVVSHALFSGNREIGVLAVGPGALARLSDVVVRQTDAQACAATTCPERPYGVALAAVVEARLAATRFQVLESALCGVLVAEDGQVDLSLGLVSGSPIGVCLQVDGYAIARLTEGVRYLNNGTNLDATSLPVPEPVSLVDTSE